MTLTRTFSSKLMLAALFAMGASLGSVSAQAQTDAQATYRADVARCNAGQTNQDRATCLREAGAALQEARRNRLTRGDANYEQNQIARCAHLSGTEQSDCLALMRSGTTTQGSVLGGGVIRETTITVPAGTPGSTTTYSTPAAPVYTTPAAPVYTTPGAPSTYTAPVAPPPPVYTTPAVPGTGTMR